MFALRFTVCIIVIAFIMAVVMLNSSEAAYRKPPFNGSIFGKRNSVGKYFIKIFLLKHKSQKFYYLLTLQNTIMPKQLPLCVKSPWKLANLGSLKPKASKVITC